MKNLRNISLIVVLSIALMGLGSCNKDQLIDNKQNESLQVPTDLLKTSEIDGTTILDEYTKIMEANQARLAALGEFQLKTCVETAYVPQDFATIQEAIDAVCDYGTVVVSEGDYYEALVTLYKPGVHLKANGDVTLHGRINISAEAIEAKIQKFTISPGTNSGIVGVNVTGVTILQNTITGPGNVTGPSNVAIYLTNSNDNKIFHNHIESMAWGILLASFGVSESTNNMILENTLTGLNYSSPIHIQGRCSYNSIQNNTITDCTNTVNAGIMFILEGTDNNNVRNNHVSNLTTPGIWLTAGSNNTIGPNNTSNENAWGFYFSAPTSHNNVFNNTALDNTACDIVNLGTNNTFSRNTANCTEGL